MSWWTKTVNIDTKTGEEYPVYHAQGLNEFRADLDPGTGMYRIRYNGQLQRYRVRTVCRFKRLCHMIEHRSFMEDKVPRKQAEKAALEQRRIAEESNEVAGTVSETDRG